MDGTFTFPPEPKPWAIASESWTCSRRRLWACCPRPYRPRWSRELALSPDGALLCAAAPSDVLCYDVRTRTLAGRVTLSLPNAEIRPLFHPNGSRLYVLGRTSTPAPSYFISVIDTATLSEVTRIPILRPAFNDFRDSPAQLNITPDGSYLVLDESFLGTANVIDTRTNQIVRTVEGLNTGAWRARSW